MDYAKEYDRMLERSNKQQETIDLLLQQLAAILASEQQFLEALYGAKWVINVLSKKSHLDHTELIKQMEEAISIQQDTTALEAMIAKAGEVMRERCVYAADNPLWETEEAIRAIPAVTIDDMK